MWIYDGEQWVEIDSVRKPDPVEPPLQWDRFQPELQIVEHEDLNRAPIRPDAAPSANRRRRGPKIGHA